MMGEDASSQPVTVTFWILDAEQSAYRFVIAAWDAYPGLTAEEGLLARRDLTVSLRKEHCSDGLDDRVFSIARRPWDADSHICPDHQSQRARMPWPVMHLVRIPKCASSSFSSFLRKQAGCEPEGHCCAFPGDPAGSCSETRTCQSIIGCSGHGLRPERLHDPTIPSVTVLREPKSRYLSAFTYPGHHSPGVNLSTHLAMPRWDNVMIKALLGYERGDLLLIDEGLFEIAKRNLEHFAFVGLVEEMDATFRRFCAAFPCPHPHFRPAQERRQPLSNRQHHMSPSDHAAFEASNKWDLRLYAYVHRRLHQRSPTVAPAGTFSNAEVQGLQFPPSVTLDPATLNLKVVGHESTLQRSRIQCVDEHRCRVKNLYYDVKKDSFFANCCGNECTLLRQISLIGGHGPSNVRTDLSFQCVQINGSAGVVRFHDRDVVVLARRFSPWNAGHLLTETLIPLIDLAHKFGYGGNASRRALLFNDGCWDGFSNTTLNTIFWRVGSDEFRRQHCDSHSRNLFVPFASAAMFTYHDLRRLAESSSTILMMEQDVLVGIGGGSHPGHRDQNLKM